MRSNAQQGFRWGSRVSSLYINVSTDLCDACDLAQISHNFAFKVKQNDGDPESSLHCIVRIHMQIDKTNKIKNTASPI